MLSHFTENLPTTRISHPTVVLLPGATDVLVDVSPVNFIQTIVVKACPADTLMKVGGISEDAGLIAVSEVRYNLAIDTIHLSSVTGGTVTFEIHGR